MKPGNPVCVVEGRGRAVCVPTRLRVRTLYLLAPSCFSVGPCNPAAVSQIDSVSNARSELTELHMGALARNFRMACGTDVKAASAALCPDV